MKTCRVFSFSKENAQILYLYEIKLQSVKAAGVMRNQAPAQQTLLNNTTSVVQEVNDIATCELPVFELYTSGHNFQHSI